jgi:hypothetical protein
MVLGLVLVELIPRGHQGIQVGAEVVQDCFPITCADSAAAREAGLAA